MEYSINSITNEDREPIIDIFNHYVENSFAAYPENRLPYQAFDTFLRMSNGFQTGTIKNKNGKMVGLGMLRRYNPMSTFPHTTEITYSIHQDYTGKDT